MMHIGRLNASSLNVISTCVRADLDTMFEL